MGYSPRIFQRGVGDGGDSWRRRKQVRLNKLVILGMQRTDV